MVALEERALGCLAQATPLVLDEETQVADTGHGTDQLPVDKDNLAVSPGTLHEKVAPVQVVVAEGGRHVYQRPHSIGKSPGQARDQFPLIIANLAAKALQEPGYTLAKP